MRIPILSMFISSPFEGLQEHAEKVKEGAVKFRSSVECYLSVQCDVFERSRIEVANLEQQADAVKRRIRGHLPKGTLMPVHKFQFFRYLREQDNVIDAFEDVLDWLSFRPPEKFPEDLKGDIIFLIDAVVEPIDGLCGMVGEARKYFRSFSEKQRRVVKDHIRELRKKEHRSDILEATLKQDIFATDTDAVTIFHLIRLVEMIGSVADHAENAGDMMRAMIAK
ncbi:MAG: TIGR00153 family protein [Deltaproteobacteria bacterium]|nr:TIGR00153 family protein [Deltaproteobacteria bacterium]